MLYNIIRFLFPLFTIIFSQKLNSNELYQFENKSLKDVSLKSSANASEVASKMVEIETRDGNIFLGYVIEENDDFYKLRTKDGMIIDIPNVSIINLIPIETRENDGKVYRADPNKSLYIYFAAIFTTVWTVFIPSTKIAWKIFKDLPEPTKELKQQLKYTK